jgi:hypothetical protein
VDGLRAAGAVARSAIRAAYEAVRRFSSYSTKDGVGLFAAYRNADDLVPGPGKPIPVPTDGAARFVWEVAVNAEPWLPLDHEQDDALADYVARTKAKTAPVAV